MTGEDAPAPEGPAVAPARVRVRWTAHGPVEVADEPDVVDSPAPPLDDRAAVRERLSERGLLRREPGVRIRDVAADDAGDDEAPERPAVLPTPSEDRADDTEHLTRRQTDAARRARAEADERARRHRWKVLAAGAVLVVVASAAALGVSGGDEAATDGGPTGAVCATFRGLRADFAAGATAPAAVRIALDDLALAADDAIPDVRLAAQRWAASGRPGDETFEAAAVELDAACTPTP